ncbi:MAG: hypothetical protein ACP5I4_16080 [Oceanipulchritudo sp.]
MTKPFFDTSILIGGLIDLGDSSTVPIAIIDKVAAGAISNACTAWHCCLEFYSVATRLPEEFRLLPHVALQLLDNEVLARLRIGFLPENHRRAFLLDAVAGHIAGGRIYDAHIGYIAMRMGASVIVTENKKHFNTVLNKGLPVLSAREYLDSL